MSRPNLTLAEARDMEFESLVERCGEILAEYDKPEVEPPPARLARLEKTLEEMPMIHRWFLQLFSFCDHWTDTFKDMWGQGDRRYKAMRERRDLFDNMARAARSQYDGASRVITVMTDFDPTGMPRQRRGPDG